MVSPSQSAPKVLVIEGDPNFAAELRRELDNIGAITRIVDDGNEGLRLAASEPPTIILLSIELPRMSGFSICNKLKRDPLLKDIPLIIMSSEQGDETFEQHKTLRTRAEVYLHKPIVMEQLLKELDQLISLNRTRQPSEEFILDSDIELQEAEPDGAPDDFAPVPIAQVAPTPPPAPATNLDTDVDTFTNGAFDALLGAAPSPEPPVVEARQQIAPSESTSTSGDDALARIRAELEREKQAREQLEREARESKGRFAELEAQASRTSSLEQKLTALESEAQQLREKAASSGGESDELLRLRRELDELKSRPATPARTGGTSREFLDLREALNKKDREILSLREQQARIERELLESRDGTLSLEREKADLEDRIDALEQRLSTTESKLATTTSDLSTTSAARDELARDVVALRERSARLDEELDAARKQASADADAHKSELARRDEDEAALISKHEGLIASLSEAHAKATVEAAEKAAADKQAALDEAAEKAAADKQAALDDASQRAAADKQAALDDAAEKAAADKQAALDDATEKAAADKQAALDEARKTADEQLTAAHEEHATKVAELEADRDKRLADAASEHASLIAGLKDEHEGARKALEEQITALEETIAALTASKKAAEEERDQKIEQLSGELASKSAEHEALGAELAKLRGEHSELQSKHEAIGKELEDTVAKLTVTQGRVDSALGKWADDCRSLDKVKDALAAALAHIEQVEARPLD